MVMIGKGRKRSRRQEEEDLGFEVDAIGTIYVFDGRSAPRGESIQNRVFKIKPVPRLQQYIHGQPFRL